MNEELTEICSNLKQLSKLLKEKNELEKILKITKEEYVKNNIKQAKPKKKLIKKVENPEKPVEININKKLILTLSYIVAYIFLFGTVVWGVVTELNVIFITLLALGVFFTIIILPTMKISAKEEEYKKAMNDYEMQCQKNNKIIENNKKNEEYNRTYHKLLEQYMENVKKIELEYDEIIIVTKEGLSKIETEMKKYEGIINPKFYQGIDEIVEIIEDGRAESVKEALNIFVSDMKQNQLIIEQKEANRLADKKLKDDRRHNLAMENEARRQSEYALKQVKIIKEQEEAKRRGAPSCWQCKNWPCGGDPAYCGSFTKKD